MSDNKNKNGRKKLNSDLSNYIFGRVPPQAQDLEMAVIGALLMEKEAMARVADMLNVDTFYVDAHQLIYAALLSLFKRGGAIDTLTVKEELQKTGKLEEVGGPFYLMELTNKVSSTAHLEEHAKIIQQKHISRQLIAYHTLGINEAYEDTRDVFEILGDAEIELMRIGKEDSRRSNYSTAEQTLSSTMTEIDAASKNDSSVIGIPSGFSAVDAILHGFQKPNLIVIAARPSMGKTSLCMGVAHHSAIELKKPTAIFSLEMSKNELTKRLLSIDTMIPLENILLGRLNSQEWDMLHKSTSKMLDKPLYIDDTPCLTIMELRTKAIRMKMLHGIELIIVDYLQLMNGTDESSRHQNREQEISNISRNLKGLAKELDVPVIALSQLNRAVEGRADRKPMLSDLRESGAIEQDADIVMFIFRPEVYGEKMVSDLAGQGIDVRNKAEIIISKHRNGALGDLMIGFDKRLTRFYDLEERAVAMGGTRGEVKNFYEKPDTNTPF